MTDQRVSESALLAEEIGLLYRNALPGQLAVFLTAMAPARRRQDHAAVREPHAAWNQNGLLHSYDEYKRKFWLTLESSVTPNRVRTEAAR